MVNDFAIHLVTESGFIVQQGSRITANLFRLLWEQGPLRDVSGGVV